MILKKKKSYFEEELDKNRNKLKELWKALKSLSLSSDKARQSKISLKKDCAIHFEAPNLLAKQPKTTTPRLHATYPMTLNFQTYLMKLLKKSLLSQDTSKAAGMNQIPAKLMRDCAEVLFL